MIKDLYKLVLFPFFVTWSMQRTTDSFLTPFKKQDRKVRLPLPEL